MIQTFQIILIKDDEDNKFKNDFETDLWFISAENKDIKKHSNLNNNENLKDSKPFYLDVEHI